MNKLFLVILLVSLLCSCHSDDKNPQFFDPGVEVVCVYTPRGISDNTTESAIYTGVVRTTDSLGIAYRMIFPITFAEGADSIAALVNKDKPGYKRLIIATDPEYSRYLKQMAEAGQIEDSDSTKLLVLDGEFRHRDVYTAHVSYYGMMYQAGYLAGKMADVDSVKIHMANTAYLYLREGMDGFVDGFTKERNNTIDVYDMGADLKDSTGGFLLRDMAYMVYAPTYKGHYDMVLPLCGETTMGFLRYTRDNPGSFYTVGVGSDMSIYSQDVPFSCIEHTERVVSACIEDWVRNSLSHYRRYGIDEAWVQLFITKTYRQQLLPWAEAIYDEAVRKEGEYAK